MTQEEENRMTELEKSRDAHKSLADVLRSERDSWRDKCTHLKIWAEDVREIAQKLLISVGGGQ